MCTCNFFFNIIGFFFLFCPLFLFVFIEKKVCRSAERTALSCVGRGDRDTEKRVDECREEEEGQGSEYLSLFSSPAPARSLGVMRLCRGSVMRKIPPACLVSGR